MGVEVTHFRSADDKPFIRIAIRDTGIGMKPETMDGLFLDFTQADSSISRKYQGSGLGLAICKRLVNLMGGEISVESEFGHGSTFSFTLPYVAATQNAPNSLPRSRAAKLKALRSLKILAIDDNAFNRRIIKATVESYGHDVDLAEDASRGIEAHQNGHYDLILMDVRMPEISGLDATRMIRQMPDGKNEIPIIALTADAIKSNRPEFFESGMNEVTNKPINREELLTAINRVLEEEIHVPA